MLGQFFRRRVSNISERGPRWNYVASFVKQKYTSRVNAKFKYFQSAEIRGPTIVARESILISKNSISNNIERRMERPESVNNSLKVGAFDEKIRRFAGGRRRFSEGRNVTNGNADCVVYRSLK